MNEYIKKSDLIAYITRKRDFINQNSDYYGKDGYYIADDICTDILGDIYSNVIPSAEPKTVIYSGDGYADGYMVYDMAECPSCGYKYEDGDKDWGLSYCPSCGQKLNWERSDKE